MVSEAMAYARCWGNGDKLLWTWGAQVRGRVRHRVKMEKDPNRELDHPACPYDGNVESGMFHRRSDPHPHAHIVAHVERVIGKMSAVHKSYAVHRYVLGMSHSDFPGSEWTKRRIRQELAQRVESGS